MQIFWFYCTESWRQTAEVSFLPFAVNVMLNLSNIVVTRGRDLFVKRQWSQPPVGRSVTIESLSTRVFETRTATGREHFACRGPIVTQIFVLLISNEKILINVNVIVWEQVKSENSSLPVAVRVSKTNVLKLSSRELKHARLFDADGNQKRTFRLLGP